MTRAHVAAALTPKVLHDSRVAISQIASSNPLTPTGLPGLKIVIMAALDDAGLFAEPTCATCRHYRAGDEGDSVDWCCDEDFFGNQMSGQETRSNFGCNRHDPKEPA